MACLVAPVGVVVVSHVEAMLGVSVSRMPRVESSTRTRRRSTRLQCRRRRLRTLGTWTTPWATAWCAPRGRRCRSSGTPTRRPGMSDSCVLRRQSSRGLGSLGVGGMGNASSRGSTSYPSAWLWWRVRACMASASRCLTTLRSCCQGRLTQMTIGNRRSACSSKYMFIVVLCSCLVRWLLYLVGLAQ